MKIVQILFAATLIFSGCSSPTESNQKTIRLAIIKDPPTIDTRKSSDAFSSMMHFLLNSGLTRITKKNKVINDLAESIDISEDGLTYLFTLKNTYWSDGSLITAKDFEENWKTVLSPEFPAPCVQMLYCIANAKEAKEGHCSIDEIGVEALDDKRLKVSLNTPTPFFLRLTAFPTYFPMKHSSDGKHLSSGPFVLDKWEHNSQLFLTANPKYHNRKNIDTEKLEFIVVENEGTAMKMFEQGEIDYVGGLLCPIPLDTMSQYVREKKAKFTPIPATARIYFNTATPPFNNLKIRKAISLAIDRDEIIQAIAPFPARPATGLVPTIIKRTNALPPVLEGDAKALFEEGLKEEGFENIQEINMIYCSSEMNDKTVLVIQQQIRKALGLTIHLEAVEFQNYLHRLKGGDYMMALGKWLAQFSDPISILSCFKYASEDRNFTNWENSSFQKKLKKSAYVKNPLERMRILEKAEQIISNELPICPLFHWDDCYIHNSKANNVYFSGAGPPEWTEIEDD